MRVFTDLSVSHAGFCHPLFNSRLQSSCFFFFFFFFRGCQKTLYFSVGFTNIDWSATTSWFPVSARHYFSCGVSCKPQMTTTTMIPFPAEFNTVPPRNNGEQSEEGGLSLLQWMDERLWLPDHNQVERRAKKGEGYFGRQEHHIFGLREKWHAAVGCWIDQDVQHKHG